MEVFNEISKCAKKIRRDATNGLKWTLDRDPQREGDEHTYAYSKAQNVYRKPIGNLLYEKVWVKAAVGLLAQMWWETAESLKFSYDWFKQRYTWLDWNVVSIFDPFSETYQDGYERIEARKYQYLYTLTAACYYQAYTVSKVWVVKNDSHLVHKGDLYQDYYPYVSYVCIVPRTKCNCPNDWKYEKPTENYNADYDSNGFKHSTSCSWVGKIKLAELHNNYADQKLQLLIYPENFSYNATHVSGSRVYIESLSAQHSNMVLLNFTNPGEKCMHTPKYRIVFRNWWGGLCTGADKNDDYNIRHNVSTSGTKCH